MLISPPELDTRHPMGRVITYGDHPDRLCGGCVIGLRPMPHSTDPEPAPIIEVENATGNRHGITDGRFYGNVEDNDHEH